MKNSIISKLSEEYKVLWQLSKKKKLSGEFLETLKQGIRMQRNTFKKNLKPDQLAFKLQNFGNTGKWSDHKIQELAKLIYEDKKPTENELGKWVSVEIECIFFNKQAETDFVKFIRSKGFSKFVTIKSDGSIKTKKANHDCGENYSEEGDLIECTECNPNAYGREIVVSFIYGQWDLLQMICSKLNALKTEVNKSCGLHVHFDCRHIKAAQVTKIGKRIAATVPALKQLLPPSRANNRFCSTTINTHRDGGGDNRYSFVNIASFERHQTIEIRGHSGTTDAKKMINWIKIIHVIMNTKGESICESPSGLISSFEFDADLVEWINKRYEKFSKLKANDNIDDVAQDNEQIAEIA